MKKAPLDPAKTFEKGTEKRDRVSKNRSLSGPAPNPARAAFEKAPETPQNFQKGAGRSLRTDVLYVFRRLSACDTASRYSSAPPCFACGALRDGGKAVCEAYPIFGKRYPRLRRTTHSESFRRRGDHWSPVFLLVQKIHTPHSRPHQTCGSLREGAVTALP